MQNFLLLNTTPTVLTFVIIFHYKVCKNRSFEPKVNYFLPRAWIVVLINDFIDRLAQKFSGRITAFNTLLAILSKHRRPQNQAAGLHNPQCMTSFQIDSIGYIF